MFTVDIADAAKQFPQFQFVAPLTPSAQKAAFHVRDSEGTDLCLKLISPSYSMDRLDREIQAMQNISHPNVVKLLEYTFSSKPGGSRHYLIEEFVDGSDLSAQLTSAWPKDKVVEVFGEFLDGLAELENIRVVHRDLKPSNIRIDLNQHPVIIDFGLARHLDLTPVTPTAIGAQLGTPLYFSPEQFEGTRRDIDNRTDLFAVGIMMHEALTNSHPFYQHGMNIADLRTAVCSSNDFSTRQDFQNLDNRIQMLVKSKRQRIRVYNPRLKVRRLILHQ